MNFLSGEKVGLAETRATELLPEIVPLHLHLAAHLVEPGAHAFSNAIAEAFLASRGPWSGDTCGGAVVKISGDDGSAVVVVARVQDQAHRVPDPLRRLYRPKFIQHE